MELHDKTANSSSLWQSFVATASAKKPWRVGPTQDVESLMGVRRVSWGSDFYKLTILDRLDMESHHEPFDRHAPSPEGADMGSDFYELTIFGGLDRELRHGASATTICRGGSLSRDCARQPAAEDFRLRQGLSGLYTERLARYRKKYDYVLHAYCLMPNHVHLLVLQPIFQS
jgi:hypothetical protein